MRKIIVIGTILVLVIVASLLVWLHSGDSKYRHDIAGTWTYNQDGAFTIAPDGSWLTWSRNAKAPIRLQELGRLEKEYFA